MSPQNHLEMWRFLGCVLIKKITFSSEKTEESASKTRWRRRLRACSQPIFWGVGVADFISLQRKLSDEGGGGRNVSPYFFEQQHLLITHMSSTQRAWQVLSRNSYHHFVCRWSSCHTEFLQLPPQRFCVYFLYFFPIPCEKKSPFSARRASGVRLQTTVVLTNFCCTKFKKDTSEERPVC